MAKAKTGNQPQGDVATAIEAKHRLAKPRLYKVILHNDDFTTMEFVVYVLQTVFRLSEPDAMRIMLAVHRQGAGTAGSYIHEIAETKAAKVTALAREAEYPLLCTIEPA